MDLQKTQDLLDKILKWGEDRNLILGSEPKSQFLKLVEEFGEIAQEVDNLQALPVHKEDPEAIFTRMADGIGDSAVVMTLLAGQYKARNLAEDNLVAQAFDNDNFTPDFDLPDFELISQLDLENEFNQVESNAYIDFHFYNSILTNWTNLGLIAISKLGACIARNKPIDDELWNLGFVLSTLSNTINKKFEDCLELSYGEIKNRKGKMIDGVFIKEEDLKNDQ